MKTKILSDLEMFFSLHKLPVFTRFALFSISHDFVPISLALLSFFYSELQILSVFINTILIDTVVDKLDWLKIFSEVNLVFSIGGLLDYNESPILTLIILIIMFIYIYLLTGLAVYLLILIKKNKTLGYFAERIWRLCCSLHPYLIFYPIHFTLMKIFSQLLKEQVNYNETANIALQVISGTALGLNFLFSLASLFYFQTFIKTKNPLSPKTRLLNIMNLAIKATYPYIFLYYTPEINKTLLVGINAGFGVIRDCIHFYMLPYYEYSTLKLATGVYAASTLFALTGIFSNVLDLVIDKENAKLPVILWLAFLPLFLKIYLSYLRSLMTKILLSPSDTLMNPYHLIHQWYTYKYFAKYSLRANEVSREYKENHFLYQARLKQTECTMSDSYIEEHNMDRIYILSSVLENLKAAVNRNPTSKLLKASLAVHSIKTKRLYLMTDRYIQENLESLGYSAIKNSWYLLRLKVIKQLKTANDKGTVNGIGLMDAQDYIAINKMLENLIMKIRAQLKSQMSFWEKFKSHTVQLYHLINLSKQTHKEANEVHRYWNYVQSSNKLLTPEPLLIYSIYAYLVLGDDKLGRRLSVQYNDLKLKDQIASSEENVIAQNLLGKNSVWFAISGKSLELGKILGCSNRVKDLLGIEKISIIGASINLLIPPVFGAKHDSYLQPDNHSSPSDIMHRTREIHVVNGEGYLISCYICVLLCFMSGVGLSYFALLKPIEKIRRVVFFRDDGRVISFSRNFIEDMNINNGNQKDMNIFDFCHELRKLVTLLIKENKNKPTVKKAIRLRRKNNFEIVSSSTSDLEKDEFDDMMHELQGDSSKLKFFPLQTSKRLFGSRFDIPDPITYNIGLKVHSSEHGNFIEITLDQINSDDMVGPEKSVVQKVQEKSNAFPSTAFSFSKIEPSSSNLLSLKKLTRQSRVFKRNSVDLRNSQYNTEITMKDITRKSRKTLTISTNIMPFSSSIPDKEEKPLLMSEISPTSPLSPSLLNSQLGKKTVHILDEVKIYEDNSKSEGEEHGIVLNKVMSTPYQSPTPVAGDIYDVMGLEDDKTNLQVLDKKSQVLISAKRDHVHPFNQSKDSLEQRAVSQSKPAHQKIDNALLTSSNLTSSKSKRAEKVIKMILQSRKLGKFAIGYITAFLFVMIISMLFMLWFSLNAPLASKNIQVISTVLQTLQLRTFATNLCNQETRLGSAMNTIANDITLYPSTLVQVIGPNGTIPDAFKVLTKYAMELENAVALADDGVQDLFYEKNVRINDRDDDNNLVLFGMDNNLQVLDQILSNGFLVASYPYPPAPLPELPTGFRFIFDNSVNDLLVVSESISEVLFAKIENICDAGKAENLASLIASLIFLILFAICSAQFIIKINSRYFRFLNILLTVHVNENDKLGDQLLEFEALLIKEYDENEYIKTLHYILTDTHSKKAQAKRKEKMSKNNGIPKLEIRKAQFDSINKVYKQNLLLFVELLIALIIVAMCLVLFYFKSQDSLDTLHNKQIQMNTALSNINQQSLLSVQLQGMILDNAATTLRNLPIEDSIVASINRMNQVTQLQQMLEDTSGQLSQAQRAILFNYECSDLSTTLFDYLDPVALNRKCLEITNGAPQIGLATLLPNMASKLEALNAQFWNSDRTEDFIRTLYIETISIYLSPIDVSVALFAISYDATALTVKTDLAELHQANIVMAGMAIVVSFVICSLIWWLVVKRMVTKQFEIKQILDLVPTRLILDSAHLMRYLMEHSKREVQEIRTLSGKY